MWEDFQELSVRRIHNGMVMPRLTHEQIEAWARLNRVEVTPLELEMLFAVDDLYVEILA